MARLRLSRSVLGSWLAVLAGLFPFGPVAESRAEGTRLLRQPGVNGRHVAFAFGGNLRVADLAGGEARRLTSTPAVKSDPHLSPDGQAIAFTSNRSGVPMVWGGPVKSSVHYPLVDGGALTVPDNAVFDPINREWIGENEGIPPDVEVLQDARFSAEGRDLQLERGVKEALWLLSEKPRVEVVPPAFPRPARHPRGT